jgi:serine/threonine protein kinase
MILPSKISPENREFLEKLKVGSSYEYVISKSIHNGRMFIGTMKNTGQKIIIKPTIWSLKNDTSVNLAIDSFRSIFTFLGENSHCHCKSKNRFVCYKDIFIRSFKGTKYTGISSKESNELFTGFTVIYDMIPGENLLDWYVDSYEGVEDEWKYNPLINIAYSLLTSLDILHSLNIYHRDIKPENIIYDENAPPDSRTILIDFDFSCKSTEKLSLCHNYPGTMLYAASSVLYPQLRKSFDVVEWDRADIVSAAVSIYRIATGDYNTKDVPSILRNEVSVKFIIEKKFSKRPVMKELVLYMYYLMRADIGMNTLMQDIIIDFEEKFMEYIDKSIIKDYFEQKEMYQIS